ncbi:MAG: fibronectin type III domain-containing protein [candidate division WOR-3 bacterium]
MIFFLFLATLISPPTALKVFDTPNDEGGSISIEWQLPPEDLDTLNFIQGYEIYRAEKREGPFENVGFSLRGKNYYEDKTVKDGKEYFYYVQALGIGETAKSEITGPVVSSAQWFNTDRINVLIATILFSFIVIWYIERAKKGEKLFIRPIPGLEAIDDAVGRATEMGRPILFSFGLGYITDVVTISALSILGKIARKAAEYATRLIIPNYDPIVMTAAQETVKEAYSEVGRPDLYREEDITYLTADQFGYAAGVDGIILREKPGAIFWQGYFFAESLILAETGHRVGAIQIAGTVAITQLPFFIAACDYTLIGEEMYAASCYLKPEPHMLGSLKGEDWAKALINIFLVIVVLIATIGFFFKIPVLNTLIEKISNWFTVR